MRYHTDPSACRVGGAADLWHCHEAADALVMDVAYLMLLGLVLVTVFVCWMHVMKA